jgi:hypothetical protein
MGYKVKVNEPSPRERATEHGCQRLSPAHAGLMIKLMAWDPTFRLRLHVGLYAAARLRGLIDAFLLKKPQFHAQDMY